MSTDDQPTTYTNSSISSGAAESIAEGALERAQNALLSISDLTQLAEQRRIVDSLTRLVAILKSEEVTAAVKGQHRREERAAEQRKAIDPTEEEEEEKIFEAALEEAIKVHLAQDETIEQPLSDKQLEEGIKVFKALLASIENGIEDEIKDCAKNCADFIKKHAKSINQGQGAGEVSPPKKSPPATAGVTVVSSPPSTPTHALQNKGPSQNAPGH